MKKETGQSPYEQDKLSLRLVPDEPTKQDQGEGMTPEEIDAFLNAPIEPNKGTGNG